MLTVIVEHRKNQPPKNQPHRPHTKHAYVGRPTPLGNPYHMATEADRNEVCERYEKYFNETVQDTDTKLYTEIEKLKQWIRDNKHEPITIFLYCYCAPKRCHAETIQKHLLNQ